MSKPASASTRRWSRRKMLATAIIVALTLMTGASFTYRLLATSDPDPLSYPNTARSEEGGNIDKQPMPPPGTGAATEPDQAERALWEAARKADNEDLFEQYLSSYPQGEFVAMAEAKLRGLTAAEPDAARPPVVPEPEPDGGETVVGGLEPPEDEVAEAPLPSPLPQPPVPAFPSGIDGGGGAGGGGSGGGGLSGEGGLIRGELPHTEPSVTPDDDWVSVGRQDDFPVVAPVEAPDTAAPAPEPFTLTLFPTLDAQGDAEVGEIVEVLVALTEEQLTRDVEVRAARDTAVTADGALELRDLPASDDGWLMDVDLVAPGFELEGGGEWIEQMQVYPYGDSDYLRYRLRALPISGEAREVRIKARFVLDGRYLGSVSRPIVILRQRLEEAAEAPGMAGGFSAGAGLAMGTTVVASPTPLVLQPEVPDLTVMLDYEEPSRLGVAVMSFYSPHFPALRAEVNTDPDITAWLALRMGQLAQLSLTRGATPRQGSAAPPSREIMQATVAGIGRELYQNYVPPSFKEVFWRLKERGQLRSIQITTNNTALPWEIVLPVWPDGSRDDEFLGVGYRLARWALRDNISQDDVPRDSVALNGIAAIAPPYEGGAFLPFQEREVVAISKLAGFHRLGGDFASVRAMLSGSPQSFVHFSGHGQISDSVAESPVFAIRLSDALLEPATWQALTTPPFLGQGTFYFFNACDIGGSSSYAGFLQGWGPALLQSGASGFIGGMWPLPDRSAADFSSEFYALLAERLALGPTHLADVLRKVRSRFYETGDPTYLAYSYYGNANLRITPP